MTKYQEIEPPVNCTAPLVCRRQLILLLFVCVQGIVGLWWGDS